MNLLISMTTDIAMYLASEREGNLTITTPCTWRTKILVCAVKSTFCDLDYQRGVGECQILKVGSVLMQKLALYLDFYLKNLQEWGRQHQ